MMLLPPACRLSLVLTADMGARCCDLRTFFFLNVTVTQRRYTNVNIGEVVSVAIGFAQLARFTSR